MRKFLTTGCILECTMGVGRAPFIADEMPGAPKELGLTVATILACKPMANIPTFGLCNSQANPATLAATVAASGVPTPGPCIPVPAPWMPPALSTDVVGLKLAMADSKSLCAYGGMISATKVVPGPGSGT